MKKIEYDRLEKHAKRHTDFIEKYSDLMVEFKEEGPTEKMVNKVLSFVMDWLKDHIVEVDMAYVRYSKEGS
jgi:hemerythrin-like metal-binding protein